MLLKEITQELTISPEIQASAFLKDICLSTIAMYSPTKPTKPWIGYLAEEQGSFVGTCAFKSPPKDGIIEIAYFTFPEHEHKGVASRMAQNLVDIAILHGVKVVTAQTLPEHNASTRILEKLGFELAGSETHPEDGEVWAWRKWIQKRPAGAIQ